MNTSRKIVAGAVIAGALAATAATAVPAEAVRYTPPPKVRYSVSTDAAPDVRYKTPPKVRYGATPASLWPKPWFCNIVPWC